MTMGPTMESRMRTSTSLTPPPRLTSTGSFALQSSRDLRLVLQDLALGVMGSGHVQKLNLGDHDVAGVVGGEAAAGPGHLGGVGAGGQDGGFLRGHGDDVILAVDHEVDGHAQGIGIAADDVLDHMVGLVHIQRVGVLENGLFFLGQAAELGPPPSYVPRWKA